MAAKVDYNPDSFANMKPLEKIFLGAIALVGFVNLGLIGTVGKALFEGQIVQADIFNSVLLALVLQAILVATSFVWKILQHLERAEAK